ncbi:MAG: DUF4097 family beta strand repeat protein [Gemmatimonadetes bacterium]|nr:DUF4097 family beta strand repeat protein [Gemmatimonadota bacterium]
MHWAEAGRLEHMFPSTTVEAGVERLSATRVVFLLAMGVAWPAGEVAAQDWCHESRRAVACEVREYSFASDGDLEIDGGMNGGIHVTGWDGDEVRVEARVRAQAPEQGRAEEILNGIEIYASARSVEADGPDMGRREGWSVSYRVFVPHATDLELETHNGGISLEDVSGRIRMSALNGGVKIAGAGGDVVGRTTNGGLSVELSGDRWAGEGLDLRTTNGGVTVAIPEGYSAEFETATVNGGFALDVPMTLQGRLGRRLRSTLGDGGAPVRVTTTNGGVKIRRAGR